MTDASAAPAESVTAESVTAESVTAESVTAESVTAESVTAESVTQLLRAMVQGDAAAPERLAALVYDELHVLAVAAMRGEADGHTLQPTELVHAAFSRLVESRSVVWQSRQQFYAIAARAMRRLLVDHARARRKLKRDGGERIPLTSDVVALDAHDVDVLDLNDALDKLARLDARQVQVVELRYFGGFSIDEIAEVLQISPATVKRDWTVARAFLRQALAEYADERARG
jgi:RNA polymerase sigma factor (TIGR02999 family)